MTSLFEKMACGTDGVIKTEMDPASKIAEEHMITIGHSHLSSDPKTSQFWEESEQFAIDIHGLTVEGMHSDMEVRQCPDKKSFILCFKQEIKLLCKKDPTTTKKKKKEVKIKIERYGAKKHKI